jgi:hypothetical protein
VVVGKTFNFGGMVNQPNQRIDVQVMNTPKLDPEIDGSWTTIATTYSSATPDAEQSYNDEHPSYGWSTTARPVPTASFLARWPAGGVARFRAVGVTASGAKIPIATFDNVNFGCLIDQVNAGAQWDDAGALCEGMGGRTATMVHTTPLPVPAGGFLTDKGGFSSPTDLLTTAMYYANINAPSNLAQFLITYGFITQPLDVVRARYFNDGDLGLGRWMNCKSFASFTGPGVACFVQNYSDGPFEAPTFNENPVDVLAQTISGVGAFATVAMVYQPGGQTKFIVYGADGDLSLTAPLDASQDNVSIPQNCLSCHGINSNFNESTYNVDGNAEFLPFDPYAFKFSNTAPWRLVDQQESFRKLNQLIKQTQPPAATNALIDGMYAPQSVNTVGATAKNTFIPSGWHTAASNDFDGKSLYDGVVKPYCRTCHVSANQASLDFDTEAEFKAAAVLAVTCGTKKMPHAERVQKKFWESGARAYITTGIPTTYPNALLECKP